MARTVQEAEVVVSVQLGVRHARSRGGRGKVGAPVRLALARPGRRIAPVGLRATRQTRAGTTGERGLQLGPRHVRIAPPHAGDSTRTDVRIFELSRSCPQPGPRAQAESGTPP